jgi:Cu/Ag efflux pump CusA
MAWAIIGGTVVSTILTLYVVPALYIAVSRERQAASVEDDEMDLALAKGL